MIFESIQGRDYLEINNVARTMMILGDGEIGAKEERDALRDALT